MKHSATRNHILNAFRMVAIGMLVALMPTGCNRNESVRNYAPGDTEHIKGGIAFHLQDGVLIRESTGGEDHYYLVDGLAKSYELTQEGLRVELKDGVYDTPRAPVGKMAGVVRAQPGSSTASFTQLNADSESMKNLVGRIRSDTTVDSVVEMTK